MIGYSVAKRNVEDALAENERENNSEEADWVDHEGRAEQRAENEMIERQEEEQLERLAELRQEEDEIERQIEEHYQATRQRKGS